VTTTVSAAPPLPADLEDLLRGCDCRTSVATRPRWVATAKAQRWEHAEVPRAVFAEEVAGRERSAAGFPTTPAGPPHPGMGCAGGKTSWCAARPAPAKRFLLEALGQQAVVEGLKVAWFTLEDLGVLLRRRRADDTVTKAIARVLRADLVIVDDIGLLPVAAGAHPGVATRP
jgi:hypothetical protein